LAAAGALVIYVFVQAGGAYRLAGTGLLAGVGIAGGAATVWLAVSWRTSWAATALAASLVAVNWTLVLRVMAPPRSHSPAVCPTSS
jgi:hypothetical protein